MPRLSSILLIMLGVCAAVPAAAQDSEFIGYTAITRNGAAGVLVFNEDCDNTFPGRGARICTSGDFIRGNLPTRPRIPAPTPRTGSPPASSGR